MPRYVKPDFERKICPPSGLKARLKRLPRPLVFTNGCFDILHRGHVSYLAQAKHLGACLVVAINSDASVRRQDKGRGRPVNALSDRLAVVAALASVDIVTWFDDDTPLKLILACKPDVLVKGGDWKRKLIVGSEAIRQWGGILRTIPFMYRRSTTALLKKIRRSGLV
jgi:rfaE bifunctional protein nucleotidyltransferase chain/domain